MKNYILKLLILVCFLVSIPVSYSITADQLVSKPVPKNTIRVTVVFSNDVHGGIMRSEAEFLNPEFPPMLGGAASAVRIINALKERANRDGQHIFITDAGDIYQGAPIGTVTRGQAIVEYFNSIGMDWVAVGNHDLDHGYWTLDSMIAKSHFPWIATNVKDKATKTQYPNTAPWIIKQVGGVKIGIIGLSTTSTKFMSFPKNVATIEFEDEIPALKKAMEDVKRAGAQSIWVTFHHGIMFDEEQTFQELLEREKTDGFQKQWVGNAQELAHRVPGIDVMFCGHIHVGKPRGWVHPINHTLMLQNYGHGGNVGAVDIYLDQSTGRVVKYDTPADNSMLFLLQEEQWGRDDAVDKKIQAIVDTVERGMDEIIGESTNEFIRGDGNAPMVLLVADAMRDYAKADIAIQNAGGVRENIAPGYITRRNIFHIEPFGNELVQVSVSGQFLKELLDGRVSKTRLGAGVSGLTIKFDGNAKQGERITDLIFDNGKIFHPDSIYTLATSDYLIMGNSGMAKLTEIPQDKIDWMGVRLSETLIEFIQKKSPLTSRTKQRWIDINN